MEKIISKQIPFPARSKHSSLFKISNRLQNVTLKKYHVEVWRVGNETDGSIGYIPIPFSLYSFYSLVAPDRDFFFVISDSKLFVTSKPNLTLTSILDFDV